MKKGGREGGREGGKEGSKGKEMYTIEVVVRKEEGVEICGVWCVGRECRQERENERVRVKTN